MASQPPAASTSTTKSNDPFAVLDAPVVQGYRDVFNDFINGAVSDVHSIKYWANLLPKRNATHITLTQALAQMALDFLSAPATSTDVERLFSHSGLVVSKRRHNLTAEHIRQSTILGNWLSVGVVPVAEVCRTLDKRYGKKADDGSESEWSDSEEEKEDVVPEAGDEGDDDDDDDEGGATD